jgi:hypothetical protein
MNHPLMNFHRPRYGNGFVQSIHGLSSSWRGKVGMLPDGRPMATYSFVPPKSTVARRKPVSPAAPPPFIPPKPKERRHWRWYQYSLRSLLVLTLLVSLAMSWYAVKMKRALAQKKAVEAILAAGGTVAYDYEFDESGDAVKGATGRGPTWLRGLLGPDYFDKVVNVDVNSKEGIEVLAGLTNLKSLMINTEVDGTDDLLNCLPIIEGVDELRLFGKPTKDAFANLERVRRLKRLSLCYQDSNPVPTRPAPLDQADLSKLRTCKDLQELAVLFPFELTDEAVRGIGELEQMERLSIATGATARLDLHHIRKLIKLRELAIGKTVGAPGSPFPLPERAPDDSLALKHVEVLSELPRLETLDLSGSDIFSSDLEFLQNLHALQELDLSDCPNIDDDAAKYLTKLKGLKKLNLLHTKITDDAAERVDDALPDCEVVY